MPSWHEAWVLEHLDNGARMFFTDLDDEQDDGILWVVDTWIHALQYSSLRWSSVACG